jgi:HlyD family secretion protein
VAVRTTSEGINMDDEDLSEVKVVEPVSADESSLQTADNQAPSRSWMTALLLGTCLGIGITVIATSILRPRDNPQPKAVANQTIKPAMTVTVTPVENDRVDLTLDTTGTVAARDLIPVLPQTNGLQIKLIPEDVKEGSLVQKGQVLAILDDSVLQTQVNQAKADMESNQADVESKQADFLSKQAAVAANQATVRQRQADLAQAEAKLEEAQKNLQRYQQLAAAGAVSQQELDTRGYTVKTALESVRVAQENIRAAQANVNSSQANTGNAQATVNKAKAGVRSSAARLQQLKTQLGQTVVRSPVVGVIAEKLARVGDVTGVPPQTQVGTVVGGTQKLFSIIKDGKLELQAKVPENQLSQVKIGARVEITSATDQRIRLEGRVREIQPVINDRKREATVKIDLPRTDLLKVGMFARAKIRTDSTQGLLIPQKAVRSQPDGSVIIFTLVGEDLDPDPNIEVKAVLARKVEVGEIINGDKVAIKSGLQLNENVVIDGAGYLKDGDHVRVVKEREQGTGNR